MKRWLGLIAVGLSFVQAQENYQQWQHSRNLTVDGANLGLTELVLNFPFPIRLDATNFDFDEAHPDGRDIRFTRADGVTRLPHEIVDWDTATNTAEVWVLADSVHIGSATEFLMFHGNVAAADSSSGTSVFNLTTGFVDVFHLGEVGNEPNSANGRPSADTSDLPSPPVAGIIGGAADFRGGYPPPVTGSYPNWLITPAVSADFSEGFTFSFWANSAMVMDSARFFETADGDDYRIKVMRRASSDTLQFSCLCYGGSTTVLAPGALIDEQWHHFTVTKNAGGGGEMNIYRNGSRLAAIVQGNPSLSVIPEEWVGGFLGRSFNQDDSVSSFYWGHLDEAQFHNVERDSNWVRLSYATQRPDSNVVFFGQSGEGLGLHGPARYEAKYGKIMLPKGRLDYADGLVLEKKESNGPYNTFRSKYQGDRAVVGWNNNDGPSYGVVLDPFEGVTVGIHYDSVGGQVSNFSNINASGTTTPAVATSLVSVDANSTSDTTPSYRVYIEPHAMGVFSYIGQIDENPETWTRIDPDGITSNGVIYAESVTANHVTATDVVTTPRWQTVPDYVFDPSYRLRTLTEVEAFVKKNRHLPDIPSARHIADKGLNLTEMNLKLLKTVEEITLHLISLEKELNQQKSRNDRLERSVHHITTSQKGRN